MTVPYGPLPLDTGQPLYLRLSHVIEQAIQQQVFTEGDYLPSIRQLAKLYQVSVNTVVTAYRHLEAQGMIAPRPQAGFYVCSRLPALTRTLGASDVPALPSANVLELIDKSFASWQRKDYVNVSLACPIDASFYPVERMTRIVQQLLRRNPARMGAYALPPGSLALRQQILRRMWALGVISHSDNITVTHGCSEAIQLALRAVTKPGDTVALESPTYFFLIPMLANMGINIIEIPTHAETGLSVEALQMYLEKKQVQAIVAMPNLHNPLGCSMPLAAKKKLADLVNHYQVPLIEDGLYAELQFDTVLPAVKAFDENGWVLFCSSFTKTLAPDFRLGWIDAGRYSKRVQQLKGLASIAESQLLSEGVAVYLESGAYDQHLRKIRKRYAENLNHVHAVIAQYFPEGTTATKPKGGFVFWVELPKQVDTLELHAKLQLEKISVTPGVMYSPSGRFTNALRLSCCYPFNDSYRYALQRIGKVANKLAAQ